MIKRNKIHLMMILLISISILIIGLLIWNLINKHIEKFQTEDLKEEDMKSYPSYSIEEIPNFLSSEECDKIISISKDKGLEDSILYSDKKDNLDKNIRNSKQAWLYDEDNELIKSISEKVAKLINMPIENQEALQVVNYGVGGKYDPHYDACIVGTCERMNKNGGARYKTVLVYLNDVEEGGGTYFPYLDKTVKAEKGKVVIFQSTELISQDVIRESKHGGNPIIKGEKWIANKWIHHSALV
jgi:prolyl 4-hydroxylase